MVNGETRDFIRVMIPAVIGRRKKKEIRIFSAYFHVDAISYETFYM